MNTTELNKYIDKNVEICFKEFSGYDILSGVLKKSNNIYRIRVNNEDYYFRVSHVKSVRLLK